jgi:DMSO/TMAO reductase YedYZ molybdopterin-dependent catalytic subunit
VSDFSGRQALLRRMSARVVQPCRSKSLSVSRAGLGFPIGAKARAGGAEMDRRQFLKSSLAGAAAAAVWVKVPKLAYAKGRAELIRMTERPPNYESVRSTFTTRITPVEKFYLRNHFDLPTVDVGQWRLNVRGLVEKPLSLSLADLERMPQTTVEAVLQCAGNGRALFQPRVAGVQWRFGAMGNAEWTGVRLKDVLALARPKEQAAFVQLQGAERPTMDTTPAFIRAIPFEKALHADTLLALKMNGKPLAPERGRPTRIVVPGWVGDDWVRALVDIEVRADEPTAFFYSTGYRFPVNPGAPGAPIPADQMKPMTKINVKSLLGSLTNGDRLSRGVHQLAGVAFSGEAGIDRVELSFDGGKSWTRASLDGPATPYGFRVFRHAWKAEPGSYEIACRATDTTGASQPDVPVWNPAGYLYNAVDRVKVEVES